MSIAELVKLRFAHNFEMKRNEYVLEAKRYAAARSDTISLELQTDSAVIEEFATKAFEAWRGDVIAGVRTIGRYFVIFLFALVLLVSGGVAVAGLPSAIWLITSAGLAFAVTMISGAGRVLIDTIRSCWELRSYRSDAIAEMCCSRNISVGRLGIYVPEPASGSGDPQIRCHPFDKLALPKLFEGKEIISVRMLSEVGSTVPGVMFVRDQRSQAEATLSILKSLIPDDRRLETDPEDQSRNGMNRSPPPTRLSKGRLSTARTLPQH